jgi:hypothetical protein
MRMPVWRKSKKTLAVRSLRRSNSCWMSGSCGAVKARGMRCGGRGESWRRMRRAKSGSCLQPQKVFTLCAAFDPAPHAEQSPLHPAAYRRRIRQTRGIFAVRRCSLQRISGTDPLTRLLATAQRVVRRRSQPVGQDCESLPAGRHSPRRTQIRSHRSSWAVRSRRPCPMMV